MKSLIPMTCMLALTSSGAAWASDDCHRAMAEWQSREAVTAHATALGITTERLRIDDGCYEVRGRDGAGHRVELKLDPATLAPIELEVRFRAGADVSRYLSAVRGAGGAAKPAAPAAPAPSATPARTGTN